MCGLEFESAHQSGGCVGSASLILIVAGEQRRIELDGTPCRIGRGSQNTLELQGNDVSRSHALVQPGERGEYVLFDLGSRNGTILNGRHLAGPTELRDGDMVQVGEHQLRFSNPESEGKLDDELGSETILAVSARSIAVLVADIHNFTPLSVELGETRIAELMGSFNRHSGAILEGAGVWAHKYIGDAVMAIWALSPGASAAGMLRSAAGMLRSAVATVPPLASTIRDVEREFGLRAPLRLGFGINMGVASVGNLGSPGASDHTALGDVVNRAFRLESTVRKLPGDLAFGEDVAIVLRAAGGMEVAAGRHRVVLKGYATESDVYTVSLRQIPDIIDGLDRHLAGTCGPSAGASPRP